MKSIYIIIGIVLLASLSSCLKDKSNFDYHEINEFEITGLKTSYSGRSAVDTLRIIPTIKNLTDSTSTVPYQYFWVIKKNSNVLDTLSRTRDLNYPINLNPDRYELEFRLLDPSTQITWTAKTNLNIGTTYSRGWLLSGDNEQGHADIDMISMFTDTMIVRGILSASGLPTLQGGLNAWHSSGEAEYIKLWVATKSGSYYLDRLTMKGNEADRFGKFVYTTEAIDRESLNPIIFAPQTIAADGTVGGFGANWRKAVICDDGNIFASYVISNGHYYGNPVNRVAGKILPSEPALLYSPGNMESLVWYDKKNERFLYYPSFTAATSSNVLVDKESDDFPWNQAATGRTFVYGENTRNSDGGSGDGNTFTIMKDKANRYFIYKFYVKGATPSKRNNYEVQALATDFEKADIYAFSSRRTVVFYAVKNKLYAYDYNPGNERIYTFPQIGSDDISMLKFDTQVDANTNSLYIATYSTDKKGILQRFFVGTDPNKVEITAVPGSTWTDLIRIKNINWRAIN